MAVNLIDSIEQNVQLVDIAKTFSALKNQQEKNQIHASLFNLVIYAEGSRIDFFQDIVKMIIERFPCRIFFIKADSQSEKNFLYVNAAQEKVNKGDLNILCDEIEIKASGNYLKRVPFIVLPDRKSTRLNSSHPTPYLVCRLLLE